MFYKLTKLLLTLSLLIFVGNIYSAEIKKDEIIAVVNDRVILRSDVNQEIKKIENDRSKGIPSPEGLRHT